LDPGKATILHANALRVRSTFKRSDQHTR